MPPFACRIRRVSRPHRLRLSATGAPETTRFDGETHFHDLCDPGRCRRGGAGGGAVRPIFGDLPPRPPANVPSGRQPAAARSRRDPAAAPAARAAARPTSSARRCRRRPASRAARPAARGFRPTCAPAEASRPMPRRQSASAADRRRAARASASRSAAASSSSSRRRRRCRRPANEVIIKPPEQKVTNPDRGVLRSRQGDRPHHRIRGGDQRDGALRRARGDAARLLHAPAEPRPSSPTASSRWTS